MGVFVGVGNGVGVAVGVLVGMGVLVGVAVGDWVVAEAVLLGDELPPALVASTW
jgi:hypothetical protein